MNNWQDEQFLKKLKENVRSNFIAFLDEVQYPIDKRFKGPMGEEFNDEVRLLFETFFAGYAMRMIHEEAMRNHVGNA